MNVDLGGLIMPAAGAFIGCLGALVVFWSYIAPRGIVRNSWRSIIERLKKDGVI